MRPRLSPLKRCLLPRRLVGNNFVPHHLRNRSAVINNTATLASKRLGGDDPLQQELAEIRQAGERAAQLTRQLLAFSRKQILQPAVVRLNAMVADVSTMLRRLIGEDVTLVVRPGVDLAPIKVDLGQLEQVLVNLAVNARDAMPGGGTLTLETMNVSVDAVDAKRLSVLPGPYVMLTVSDTGAGIDAATQERIFEPFFTTKAAGRGTGLGLATSYGTIRQSGGSLSVRSEVGKGSTFSIHLPRMDGAPLPVRATPVPIVRRGTESILLVEDEEAVRRLATRLLSSAGYHVSAAANGMDALALLERAESPIDLVITDVVMPGMGGTELAKRIAQIRPGLRVLFTSGFTNDAIGALEHGTHFIGKPYSIEQLTRKVREALESPEGRRTPE